MDHLNISLAEVRDAAERIRTFNTQMYEELTEMKKFLNDTGASWISEAGEAIRSRFNLFAQRFETQKETIDSYARFLDTTASSYDSLETALENNASGMQA